MRITTLITISMVTGEVLEHRFYEYHGPVALACFGGGPSQSQKDLAASQTAFYNQMTGEQSIVFGEDQAIIKDLTGVFTPILKAGPNQEGFGAEEKTALNSLTTTGVSNAYAKGAEAVAQHIADQGGGNSFIPSGAADEMKQEVANEAAGTESYLQNQNIIKDYDVGRQNFYAAAGVLGGVAHDTNPVGFADAATGAGSAAGSTDSQIAAESTSPWAGIVGGILGNAASVGTGFGMKAAFPTNSSVPSGGTNAV